MSDWVVDSVLGFLHSPLWAEPVLGFIEHRCTVFDPEEENKLSYMDIHVEYKQLVEGLLESHLQDMGISEQQLLDACSAQSLRSEHLHVFEPVLAADDFELFKGLMVRKNIELELQALVHLQEQKGMIPDCMSVDGLDKAGEIDREEMQLLQEAIRASKQEYEMEQKWRRSCILEPRTTQEEETETEELCRDRQSLQSTVHVQVSECCADVPGPSSGRCSDIPDETLGAMGPPQSQATGASPAPPAAQDGPPIPGGSQTSQVPLPRVPSEPAGGVGAEKQGRPGKPNGACAVGKAQASKPHGTRPEQAVGSTKHDLSAEELRNRKEYLQQQRDRLLEAKREQLGSPRRQRDAADDDGKAVASDRTDALGAAGSDVPRKGPSTTGGGAVDSPAPATAGKQSASVEASQALEQRKRVAHKLKEELLQKK